MNSRIFTLALRRLRSRPGLTVLSLLSVVLAVGMVASIPIFSEGVSYLLLRDELLALGKVYHRPPLTTRLYFVAKENTPLSLEEAQARVSAWVYEELSTQLGLQVGEEYEMVS